MYSNELRTGSQAIPSQVCQCIKNPRNDHTVQATILESPDRVNVVALTSEKKLVVVCQHWLANDVFKVSRPEPDEGEHLVVIEMGLDEVRKEVAEGRFRHALAFTARKLYIPDLKNCSVSVMVSGLLVYSVGSVPSLKHSNMVRFDSGIASFPVSASIFVNTTPSGT